MTARSWRAYAKRIKGSDLIVLVAFILLSYVLEHAAKENPVSMFVLRCTAGFILIIVLVGIVLRILEIRKARRANSL